MLSIKELILGVLAPFALALTVTLVGSKKFPRASVGVALAAAYLVAQIGLFGWPTFTPAPVEHGLVWTTLAALAVGLLESRRHWPVWARLIWRAAAVGGSCWLFVRLKSINGQWTPAEAGAWTAGLSIATLLLWFAVEALAARLGRDGARAWHGALPLSGGIGLGALLIILDGHSLTVGQFAGALSVALLGVGAASIKAGSALLRPAGTAIVALVAPMIWIDALLWTDLTPWYAAVIAATPLIALGAVSLPPLRRRKPWIRAVAATIAATAPLLPLVAWEMKQAIEEQQAASELGY